MEDFLIIIPARGGSKGIPSKNIKPLNDKPLIQYTIEVALGISDPKDIVVSTDSPQIKEIAEDCGILVPELRPKYLASDSVGTYEVLLYEIERLAKLNKKYPVILLLQPTSPFRSALQVKEALRLYHNGLDMVASVQETKANPYYVLMEEDNGLLYKSKKSDTITRQEAPKVWELNGAIYIINTTSLKKKPIHHFTKVKKYVMDEISSHDIDTPLDWELAKIIAVTYY